jgi:hypothetical protein
MAFPRFFSSTGARSRGQKALIPQTRFENKFVESWKPTAVQLGEHENPISLWIKSSSTLAPDYTKHTATFKPDASNVGFSILTNRRCQTPIDRVIIIIFPELLLKVCQIATLSNPVLI